MARKDLDDWLWQIGAELQRISEEITPQGTSVAKSAYWQPRIDVVESGTHVIVIGEIAGMKGDEIRLAFNVERRTLSLRGVRGQAPVREEGCGGVHQLEIYYGEFEREVKLPELALDIESTKAQYRNGFLYVFIPKEGAEPEKRVVRRTITIQKL